MVYAVLPQKPLGPFAPTILMVNVLNFASRGWINTLSRAAKSLSQGQADKTCRRKSG